MNSEPDPKQYNVNVNDADAIGWTLLHHAANEGRKEVIAFLLDHGASVNMADMATTLVTGDSVTRYSIPKPLLNRTPRQSMNLISIDFDTATEHNNAVNRCNYKRQISDVKQQQNDIIRYTKGIHLARQTHSSGEIPLRAAI